MRKHRFDLKSVALTPQTLGARSTACCWPPTTTRFDYALIRQHARADRRHPRRVFQARAPYRESLTEPGDRNCPSNLNRLPTGSENRPRRLRPDRAQPLRRARAAPRRRRARRRLRYRPEALAEAVEKTGARGYPTLDRAARRACRPRPRRRWPRPAACIPIRRSRSRGRASRHDREADGHALGGRQAHGRGLRRGRRAPVRGQAEPPQCHAAAAEARDREGRFGRIYMVDDQRVLDAPAVVLRQRGVARHLGIRRRRLHEPGEPLRRPARLADRAGRKRPGLHGHARARHRGRGHRRGRRALAQRRARHQSTSRC